LFWIGREVYPEAGQVGGVVREAPAWRTGRKENVRWTFLGLGQVAGQVRYFIKPCPSGQGFFNLKIWIGREVYPEAGQARGVVRRTSRQENVLWTFLGLGQVAGQVRYFIKPCSSEQGFLNLKIWIGREVYPEAGQARGVVRRTGRKENVRWTFLGLGQVAGQVRYFIKPCPSGQGFFNLKIWIGREVYPEAGQVGGVVREAPAWREGRKENVQWAFLGLPRMQGRSVIL
jgi:hypothetical protein